DELFTSILEHCRSVLDRGRVARMRIRLYQVSGHYDEALRVGLEALRSLDVECPSEPSSIQAAIEAERHAIPVHLAGRSIAALADMPMVADPRVRLVIGLLTDSMPCAYISQPMFFPLLVVKAINFSLQHGNADESCFAYSAYGIMLASAFED